MRNKHIILPIVFVLVILALAVGIVSAGDKVLMHHFLGQGTDYRCEEQMLPPQVADNVEWFLGPCPTDTDPTEEPTDEPTVEATEQPTEEVTVQPTEDVTEEPTEEPTEEETQQPTEEATDEPTAEVTEPAEETPVVRATEAAPVFQPQRCVDTNGPFLQADGAFLSYAEAFLVQPTPVWADEATEIGWEVPLDTISPADEARAGNWNSMLCYDAVPQGLQVIAAHFNGELAGLTLVQVNSDSIYVIDAVIIRWDLVKQDPLHFVWNS